MIAPPRKKKHKRVLLMVPCESAAQKERWRRAAGKHGMAEWARGLLDKAAKATGIVALILALVTVVQAETYYKGGDLILTANSGDKFPTMVGKARVNGTIHIGIPVKGVPWVDEISIAKNGDFSVCVDGKIDQNKKRHDPCLRAMLERYLLSCRAHYTDGPTRFVTVTEDIGEVRLSPGVGYPPARGPSGRLVMREKDGASETVITTYNFGTMDLYQIIHSRLLTSRAVQYMLKNDRSAECLGGES